MNSRNKSKSSYKSGPKLYDRMIPACTLLTGVLFSACSGTIYVESTSTAVYNIDILQPAEMTFDSSVHSLMFMPVRQGMSGEIKYSQEGEETDITKKYLPELAYEICDNI